jgi:hypothetical protein
LWIVPPLRAASPGVVLHASSNRMSKLPIAIRHILRP